MGSAGTSSTGPQDARTPPPEKPPRPPGAGAKSVPGQVPPAPEEIMEKDKEASLASPVPIVLLAWSVARLLAEKPAQFDAVVARLRMIHRHLKRDDMDVGVWVPREVWLKRLKELVPLHRGRISPSEFLDELDEHCGDALYDTPFV